MILLGLSYIFEKSFDKISDSGKKSSDIVNGGAILFILLLSVGLYTTSLSKSYPEWKTLNKTKTNDTKEYSDYNCPKKTDNYNEYYQKCNSKFKDFTKDQKNKFEETINKFLNNDPDAMTEIDNMCSSDPNIADATYDLLCKLAACKTHVYDNKNKRERYNNFSINDFLYYNGFTADDRTKKFSIFFYCISLIVAGVIMFGILDKKKELLSNINGFGMPSMMLFGLIMRSFSENIRLY